MGKKTHGHSIHLSSEFEEKVRANMKRVGIRTLNRYVEFLVLNHDLHLKGCDYARHVADAWRKLQQILLEDTKKGMGG